jgi:cysteinyl-tRNA synthetase
VLHPELSADYAVPPASGEAKGRGGDAALDRLLTLRTDARKDGDFARADAIRKLLSEAGVQIEDTPEGPRWAVK